MPTGHTRAQLCRPPFRGRSERCVSRSGVPGPQPSQRSSQHDLSDAPMAELLFGNRRSCSARGTRNRLGAHGSACGVRGVTLVARQRDRAWRPSEFGAASLSVSRATISEAITPVRVLIRVGSDFPSARQRPHGHRPIASKGDLETVIRARPWFHTIALSDSERAEVQPGPRH